MELIPASTDSLVLIKNYTISEANGQGLTSYTIKDLYGL